MDNTELQELAKRAVALPGWRACSHMPRLQVGPALIKAGRWKHARELGACLPDLSHPATGGILLDMLKPVLRQSWHDSDYNEWIVELEHSEDYEIRSVTAPHLAEACALAAVALGGWPEAP